METYETGEVVRVMTHDGELGYHGEIVAVLASGKYAIFNPATEETDIVPRSGLQLAPEAESDAYIERWVDEKPKTDWKAGDQAEVFTSPGIWMRVEVYAVGPDWLTVGNGDPVYGPNDEIRESFRVHKREVRPAK